MHETCPVVAAQNDAHERAWRGAVIAERYVVTGRLGRGGMGVVLAAHDRLIAQDVAIKLPGLELGSEEVRELSRRRFRREAIGLARVSHPNVVRVSSTGEACACHREPYIAMELLNGSTVEACIAQRGPFHPRDAVDVGAAIARGLDAVHAAGLVHRDVKPSNVFLGADGAGPKLLDFGLVRLMDRTSFLTENGVLLGSIPYMAPECFLDQDLDARSDVYSLGIVLYEMLSGERPFRGASAQELVMDQLGARPVPLSSRADLSVAPSLERVVLRCLAKSPADRFQTASDLAAALDGIGYAGAAPSAREPARPRERADTQVTTRRSFPGTPRPTRGRET